MFWISGVATVVTSGLGIVGNILSLVVLCRKVRDVYWMSEIMLLHLHIWYSDFIKTNEYILCILWHEICIFKYFCFNKICDMQNRQHLNRMWCEGLVSNMKSLYINIDNFNLELALTFQATLHFMESDHYHLSCECLVISDLRDIFNFVSSAASIYLSIRLNRRWFIETVIHRGAFNELKCFLHVLYKHLCICWWTLYFNKIDIDRSSFRSFFQLFKLVLWRKKEKKYSWIFTSAWWQVM